MLKRILYSEKDIIDDIKSGGSKQDRAIVHLLKKHESKITKFITFRKGSIEDAEDVLQEGITELVLNIRNGRFKGGSSLATYLFAICKNIWYKKFKKLDRSETYKSQQTPDDIDKINPEIQLISEEQKTLILALFDHLKTKCKEVLYLWGLNYSMKEIAEKLAYSNDQVVMNKKNLCLKELRERLKNDQEFIKKVRELK